MYETLYLLRKIAGKYQGQGTNHEGQNFKGEFSIYPVLEARGFKILFTATGEDGTVYHKEESMISRSMHEDLVLWNLNSNSPGINPHELRESSTNMDGSFSLTFGFNSLSDINSFRETITLETDNLSELTYTYAWGMPGGEFKERSSVTMQKIVTASEEAALEAKSKPTQILN